jgi:hypothetical protein
MSKKQKVIKFKVYEKVYKADIRVEIDRDSCYAGSVNVNREGKWPVYELTMKDKRDFYTLVHESVHLVVHIFNDRGLPFEARNHEFIAYYLESLVQRIWHELGAH